MARALIKNPLLLGYVDEPIKSDESNGTDYTISKIGGTPVSYFLCKPYHFIISKHFPEIYVIQLIRDFSPDSRKAAICKCTLL